MGLEYKLCGVIPLKNAPDLAVALAELDEKIDNPDTSLDLNDEDDPDGPTLCIDSYSTSSHAPERIDAAVRAFAAKHAREPAALDYECEGDRDVMLVGPEGFDPDVFRLGLLNDEIEALQAERDRLAAKIGSGI